MSGDSRRRSVRRASDLVQTPQCPIILPLLMRFPDPGRINRNYFVPWTGLHSFRRALQQLTHSLYAPIKQITARGMTVMSATAPAPAAWVDMNDYCRKHSKATLLLLTAAHDYASARCLLLNGLFGGLVFGAQAIEKFLKAYILFIDPSLDVKKSFGHSMTKLLQQADLLCPQLGFSKYAPLVQRFSGHYATRYPDDPAASKSRTTADLLELDEFVIFLNENLPCPRNVKYRTGLYALITFSLGPARTVTPLEQWIKAGNQSLAVLVPRINADHVAVLTDLYPDQQW